MKELTILIVAFIAACGDHPQPPPPTPIARDQPRDAVSPDGRTRTFPGVVTASESVDIAPRAAGIIVRVNVAVGDVVKSGQILAEMDPIGLTEDLHGAEAAYGAATAAHRQALLEIEDAKRKLVIEQRAFESGVGPKVAVDEAQFAVSRAEAAAQKAAAAQAAEASRVQAARDHLGDAQLRAPFDGKVAMRFRDAGSRVEAGNPVLRLVGHGGVRIRFAVPPGDAQDISIGTPVVATIDTVAPTAEATVKQISPTIDAASGLIIVDAELSGSASADLRPGLSATVSTRAQ